MTTTTAKANSIGASESPLKVTQYDGGNYIGADGHGNLFSGISVFMIVGIKKNVPVVVRAAP